MRLPPRGRRATATAALLALALATSLTVQAGASPARADGHSSAAAAEAARQYEVAGPETVAQRTAVALTGASIDAARDHSVVITANEAEAERVRQLGYSLSPLPSPNARTETGEAIPFDFPSSDSNYHNYAEATADINSVVAANPNIMSKRVIGRSYQ